MLRVKDTCISIEDILSVDYHHEDRWNRHYLTVRYKFNDHCVNIEISDFEEYEYWSEQIKTAVNNVINGRVVEG